MSVNPTALAWHSPCSSWPPHSQSHYRPTRRWAQPGPRTRARPRHLAPRQPTRPAPDGLRERLKDIPSSRPPRLDRGPQGPRLWSPVPKAGRRSARPRPGSGGRRADRARGGFHHLPQGPGRLGRWLSLCGRGLRGPVQWPSASWAKDLSAPHHRRVRDRAGPLPTPPWRTPRQYPGGAVASASTTAWTPRSPSARGQLQPNRAGGFSYGFDRPCGSHDLPHEPGQAT